MKSKISLAVVATLIAVVTSGCISLGGTKPPAVNNKLAVFSTVNRGDAWVVKDKLLTPGSVEGTIATASVLTLATDPSDPNAIYMGSENSGMYYSYNQGDGWTQAAALRKMNPGRVFAIQVDPSNKCIILVGQEDRIFKTTDCSRTWEQVFKTPKPTELLKRIIIDPSNTSVYYAGATDGSIYKSLNGGSSWAKSGDVKKEIVDLSINKKDVRIVYAVTKSDGLYRSIDAGASWDSMKATMATFKGSYNTGYRVMVAMDKENTIFYLSKFGLLRSDDGGNTWRQIKLLSSDNELEFTAFDINQQKSDELYLISGKNLYRSIDAGQTWETRNLPSAQKAIDLKVHRKDAKVLYIGFKQLEQK